MKNVIGNTFYDLDKLKVYDGNIIIIPGHLRVNGETMEQAMVKLTQENASVIKQSDIVNYFNTLDRQIRDHGKSQGKKYTVDMNMYGDAMVELVGHTYRGQVKYMLEQIDDDFDVDIYKVTRSTSEKTAIYNVAKDLNLKVTVEDHGDFYNVSIRKPAVKATTKQSGAGVMSLINRHILSMEFDKPSVLPSEITSLTSDTYIRTIVNKSLFECSYQRGMITKHTYRICNRGGNVEVRTTGKKLTHIENLKLSDITDSHRTLLNLRLMPHGIRVTPQNEIEVITL